MGLKVTISAISFLTLIGTAVSSPALAADSCKTTCNNRHIECAKTKSEDVCLPQWGQCKSACSGKATPIPVKNVAPAPATKPAATKGK
jgi:hypothetical protein